MTDKIWNCPELLSYHCPKSWQALAETEDKHIRFCSSCAKNVYGCHSLEDFIEHSKQGHCVACLPTIVSINAPLENTKNEEEDVIWMGEPNLIEEESPALPIDILLQSHPAYKRIDFYCDINPAVDTEKTVELTGSELAQGHDVLVVLQSSLEKHLEHYQPEDRNRETQRLTTEMTRYKQLIIDGLESDAIVKEDVTMRPLYQLLLFRKKPIDKG